MHAPEQKQTSVEIIKKKTLIADNENIVDNRNIRCDSWVFLVHTLCGFSAGLLKLACEVSGVEEVAVLLLEAVVKELGE